jgi:hypothetical protein
MSAVTMAIASWIALSIWTVMSLRFSWLIPLSTGLTVGILYIAAITSGVHGWPLFRLLALLYGGIGVVNIQFESLVFKIMPPDEIVGATATGLAAVLGVSAALAWGRPRDDARPHAPTHHDLKGQLWLRVPLLALVYIVLFFTAGALIFPFVRQFYATSGLITMPSFRVLLLTEFIRGLIHVSAMMPLLRTMSGRRAQAGVVAGLALSILGGIAPLLLPIDEIMPLEVRRVHMLEIFSSNFLFGMITAFVLVPRGPSVLPVGAPVRF